MTLLGERAIVGLSSLIVVVSLCLPRYWQSGFTPNDSYQTPLYRLLRRDMIILEETILHKRTQGPVYKAARVYTIFNVRVKY